MFWYGKKSIIYSSSLPETYIFCSAFFYILSPALTVELFTDFKYNGVSKLDLRGDLMIDLIVDFLATIGDIIVDIWVNKIVTKFKKK